MIWLFERIRDFLPKFLLCTDNCNSFGLFFKKKTPWPRQKRERRGFRLYICSSFYCSLWKQHLVFLLNLLKSGRWRISRTSENFMLIMWRTGLLQLCGGIENSCWKLWEWILCHVIYKANVDLRTKRCKLSFWHPTVDRLIASHQVIFDSSNHKGWFFSPPVTIHH